MAATKRKAAAVVMQSKAQPNGDAPPLKRRASSRNASAAAAPAALNPDVDQDVVEAPNDREASPDEAAGHQSAAGPEQQANGSEREIRPKSESPLSDAPAIVEPPKGKKGGGKGKQAINGASDGVQQTDQNMEDAPKPPPAKKGRGKKVKQEEGDVAATEQTVGSKPPGKAQKTENNNLDPEADGEEEIPDEEEVKEALARPPPVNSDYLPLPWKGRLGYACLNTYLRASNPPVFSSRTCRIQSILEHRHPLQNPDEPEHPTKNKPDKSKPADVELGKRYLENICLANVKDISKMIRWNERYHIRFLRLSSEMFPFASHPEYGYKLAPFASEALAEAGRVIAELGHRVTTHPGQFTQLGSPRKQVIENAFRDLEYHDEMLSLLKLPEQQDKDAVMIMHMGGIFDGKEETLQRFRENYANLSQSVKNRLVLENDDVCYSVHDLLPICEELNIPFVLDYHHHNIVFDSDMIREGTKDIIDLYPRIKATWDRKGITQKMHYSEPTPPAVTPRQRRKHNPRPMTLPPCSPDMDLMIEAKDKEQAVFELMRTFKLPGFDSFNDIVPYVRNDDNKVALAAMNKKKKSPDEAEPVLIPDEEVGMGGSEGRVYWPPGMEEWLRPKKREVKKKEPAEAETGSTKSKEQKKKAAAEMYAAREAEKLAETNGGGEDEEDSEEGATPATKKAKAAMKKKEAQQAAKKAAKAEADAAKNAAKAETTGNAKQNGTKTNGPAKAKPTPPKKATGRGKKQQPAEEASVPTPSPSEDDATEPELDDDRDDQPISPAVKRPSTSSRKPSGRQAKANRVSYAEEGDESMEDA
ncbi:UV-damage [Hortaea werneckii]|nr:UV-damage [Hortaea werneckii]